MVRSARRYNAPVNPLAALYQQFDPARPLEATEEDLYVDWQQRFAAEDVKKILANSIALSGGVPVSRLFTGHRGVGKTTELKRVKRNLEEGRAPSKLFVSFLQAEQWMDLQDIKPVDIVYQIVRQLVSDLNDAGFSFAQTSFLEFFQEVWAQLNRELEVHSIKIPVGNAELGLLLKDVPVARSTLRSLLDGNLTNIYTLINEVILDKARAWLRNYGYEDILVIVDELDRIPQKVINSEGLTNHENIFLDHSGVLRFLNCDVLYTIPIELAYSRCRTRLNHAFGTEILTLPVIPVARRNGEEFSPGVQALANIISERAERAGVALDYFFASEALLRRLCRISGGHVRNLFILIRSAIERSDGLPINHAVLERTIRRQAIDISLPLGTKEWDSLRKIHHSKRSYDEDLDLWYGLLRDLFVFAYEDDSGLWYDWNPLLGEVTTSVP
jgi:hypothetical protein